MPRQTSKISSAVSNENSTGLNGQELGKEFLFQDHAVS